MRGILGFLVALALIGCSSEQPETAQQLRSRGTSLATSLDHLPVAENGYPFLAAVLSRQAGPADQHPFRALSWFYRDQPGAVDLTQAGASTSLEVFSQVFPVLLRALERPHFAWPSQWELGPEALVPNLVLLRDISRALCVYAVHLQSKKQTDQAVRALLAAHGLGRKMCGHSLIVIEMVGRSIASQSVPYFLHLLKSELSPADLESILREFQEPFPPVVSAVDVEFAFGCRVLEFVRDGRGEAEMLAALKAGGKFDYDRELAELGKVYLQARPLLLEGKEPPPATGTSAAHLIRPDFARLLRSVRKLEGEEAQVLCAAALELYRRKHGSYPAELAALVPELLPRLPGVELTYRRDEDAYELSPGPGGPS